TLLAEPPNRDGIFVFSPDGLGYPDPSRAKPHLSHPEAGDPLYGYRCGPSPDPRDPLAGRRGRAVLRRGRPAPARRAGPPARLHRPDRRVRGPRGLPRVALPAALSLPRADEPEPGVRRPHQLPRGVPL